MVRFRRLAASLVMAAAAAVAAAPAFATDFLQAIEDVPLAEGLHEQAEAVIFESDQGRVVRSTAVGETTAQDVTLFYLATLPALGWTRSDAGDPAAYVFERENEVLRIDVRQPTPGEPVDVRFELIVKLASTRLPE